jgi:hypothetical protein
MVEYK